MTDDDALFRLYNRELIALSERAALPRRLPKPDIAARAVSPICGSEVTVEMNVAGGKITDFGYEVEACALTRAVVAVMAEAAPGKTREDIAAAAAALGAMLAGAPPPSAGGWAGLKILLPVVEYKARHNSIMLPFEAAEKAFEKG